LKRNSDGEKTATATAVALETNSAKSAAATGRVKKMKFLAVNKRDRINKENQLSEVEDNNNNNNVHPERD